MMSTSCRVWHFEYTANLGEASRLKLVLLSQSFAGKRSRAAL